MVLVCRCGGNCLKLSSNNLHEIEHIFTPCQSCESLKLRKFKPLSQQIDLNKIDASFMSCVCGKRHLDVVMAHVLKIMVDEGVKDYKCTLRQVCTPLITPALPVDAEPYLSADSLIVLSDDVDEKCASRLFKEIPEVKGVLKGSIRDTVGIKDANSIACTYQLLAGCDLRCDIFNSPWGIIFIYKYQGQTHVEFPKPVSPKIRSLQGVLSKYKNPTVLDCTCGPGTLGIASLKAGVSNVVFNDLWYPACQTTVMNLDINGFPVNTTGNLKGLIGGGDNFKVYCLDVKDLKTVLPDKFDVCLVDVFPDVDNTPFTEHVKDLCRELIVI